jgi:hypothetical protein
MICAYQADEKGCPVMLIPQTREKHLLFLVENKSRSPSHMRDRDDMVQNFYSGS